jgi:hypothetical protein
MTFRFSGYRLHGYRRLAVIFWVLSLMALAAQVPLADITPGWDLRVYRNAIASMQAGHDPYADGTAVQRAFHATLAQHPYAPPPFTYVYSPMTLPLVRWIGRLPVGLSGAIYWLLYVACALATVWVGMVAVEERERKVFALLAPAALFFPGLLNQVVIYSGNVAYILYGLVLLGAWLGWRRSQWGWFYAAVLAASACKAPLLSLVVLPVLSARRQWLWAGLTGAAGVALFAAQPAVWPGLFHHYMEAVELQFSFNHDFSCSPAGLIADALYYRVPYQGTSAVVYLLYAIPVAGVLLYLSRRYLAGEFSLQQWMPVMLVGTILLNPRVMEYDVAPLTLPMALIAWRFFARRRPLKGTIVRMAVFFAGINLVALPWGPTYHPWRTIEGMLLCVIFAAGARDLMRQRVEE